MWRRLLLPVAPLAAPILALLGLAALGLGVVACGDAPAPDDVRDRVRADRVQPNVLLIVVDTLRADRLSIYGHERATSPAIEAKLAARGAVVETAYVQAPWTLPSMSSILTGLPPADLLDVEGRPWGVPDGATTLAERLSAAGYETAAFVANPTLHDGNGFAQGFDVFETAPYEVESMALHAEEVHGAAVDWLESRSGEPATGDPPFFLYVHYLDPHDPYENDMIVDGRSPFESEPYDGPFDGGSVHGLYLEALELVDPAADVEHLRALYDAEILYVDRFVGDLIDRLGDRLDETLIVLTSDHGEELHERGGWKHGETLDDVMIRVPLVARFDGVIPAGRRVEGTVRLLDLAPTILEAVGIEAVGLDAVGVDAPPETSDAVSGRSVWARLCACVDESTVAPDEDRVAWSRHFSVGPERIARIGDGRKDVLFDRHAPFAPADEREAVLWRRDVDRLERFESYALDPRAGALERLELDPSERQEASTKIVGHLDAWLDGLRLVAVDLPLGARLTGSIELVDRPKTVRPLFLGPDDRAEAIGARLEIEWIGDSLTKGVLVRGAVGGIRRIDLELEGDESISIVLGNEARATTTAQLAERLPIGLRELVVTSTPLASPPFAASLSSSRGVGFEPRLGLWILPPRARFEDATRDAETAARLRALGYVQ